MLNVVNNRLIIYLLALLGWSSGNAQSVEIQAANEQHNAKMAWWKDAKFGMFIHWGIYSVAAGKWGDKTSYGEWVMQQAKIPRSTYSNLASQFNPTQFNAEAWVKLAKAAGQKYIVITGKHHDGFAMFSTKASPYNIMEATPFKRDVLNELAEACRKHGMKLGFYYSQAQDWYHPGGAVSGDVEWDETHKGDMNRYIDQVVVPQVRELLSQYGDVAVLWWDTPKNMTPGMSQKLADIARQYPNLITNDRLGAGMGGDLETPEQFIPATGFPGRNWEVCMTMNGHWGYNAYDDRWKSTKDLLRKLIDIVSKGGNFLLNVGPNQYGVIPEVCQQNLTEIGEWLAINGDAIYGTQASPFPYLPWGRATRKGQTLFLHVLDWPKNGKLTVPLANKITKAWLLADPKTNLPVQPGKGESVVMLPAYAPDIRASVVAIQVEGEPVTLSIPTLEKVVLASSTEVGYSPAVLTDGEPKQTWRAKKGEKAAVLTLDLGQPIAVQALALVEPWHPWSDIQQTHELQYWGAGSWKTILKSSTNGTGTEKSFTPVTAQRFRLLLENAKEAPALSELMLFRNH